jgi:signal transduction histidine kinase
MDRTALRTADAAGRHVRAEATRAISEAWLLAERINELNCLYQISRIFGKSDHDLDRTMQVVVELLPSAWQHSEVARARIVVRGRRFTSPGFRETPWEQTCPIIVKGQAAGLVTVSYSEERPEYDEGPFLTSERSLLNTVSQRLGDFIQKEDARDELLAYQESLRSLTAQLALSEQRERRRLAEGLHDRIGQALALVSLKLAQARGTTKDPSLMAMLDEVRDLTGEIITETRSLTFELCPPILYEFGLRQAVEWLGRQFHQNHGLEVRIEHCGDLEGLSEELRATLFQATRELLNNVVKHAQAQHALVRLAGETETLAITVQDDGKGVEPARLTSHLSGHDGFGLFNIRERLSHLGGSMQVLSRPGEGTVIRLKVARDA